MFIYHEVRGSFDKALVGRKEINWLKINNNRISIQLGANPFLFL